MIKPQRFIFDSIEEYSLSCDPLNQVVRQLSRGEFQAYRYVISFPKLEVSKETTSNETLYHGVCNSDYIYMAFLNKRNAIMVNGTQLSFDDVYIVAPNEEIVSVLPPGFEVYVLLIKKVHLVALLGEEKVSRIIRFSNQIRTKKITIPRVQFVSKRIINIIEYSLRFDVSISFLMANLIQEYILNNVMILFDESAIYSENSFDYDKRLVIILRAFSYINHNLKSYIEVNDLARSCFCSTRTLEYAFKKVLSISPKQYLLMARLNYARFEFESKEGGLSVRETLEYMNVQNRGRFSGEYFDLFNEYPKDTLKRNKFD